MKQSRKSAKVAYQGLKELVKFGKFAEIEDTPAVGSINVEVADEHVAPKPKFQFAIEEIELSDDEEDQEDEENEFAEKEFDVFTQQSISNPEKDAAVTPPVVTERVSDTSMQSSISTPEHMDALIAELQQTATKPPQIISVATEPPSESDPEDSAYTLLPRKRTRRDPRPGVFITDPVQNKSTPIEPGSMAQNIQSTFTETSPVIQEIPSQIPEPIPMDQDFQSPIVEEEVIPSEGAQTSGRSFETPELDISKGKSKLPESELVDVVQLQNKVFDLEQNSAEKDLVIGKHDIRISELEKENSDKDSKILELQANLDGLTVLFFDLKQFLFQKFGDKFQPLSAEGEKITASISGPVNQTSQSSSERAARPAPDANLDTFLSSGSLSAQERREKQISVKDELGSKRKRN
ncbi:unnamed protein product [Lactuca virosa]|uniref:Uncharacterized protein n=1 Tax=Lactuca virosa TaxID=75947 RepID=A0AAU9M6P6_9ASTR|nr:unnamed protein product [Lactuca virosa]